MTSPVRRLDHRSGHSYHPYTDTYTKSGIPDLKPAADYP